MSLRINTNNLSLNAQRMLTNNLDRQRSAIEKISSGSRINRASDDAAGLAISERLRGEIRSMKQASRNISDGISLVQVAEGSMNEVSNILIRLRELSIQAASDTIADREREFVDQEFTQLKHEIDRIANSTEFDGSKILNNKGTFFELQVGIHNNPLTDRLTIDLGQIETTLMALGLETTNTKLKSAAQSNIEIIDHAIEKLNTNRANLGALQNRLQSQSNNLAVYTENLQNAQSRIRDADMAEEASNAIQESILTQSAISVLAQANAIPQLALKLIS